MAIRLYKYIGDASDQQLEFVNANLDDKYQSGEFPYLTREVIDSIARKGADIQFIGLLRKALGNDDEAEVMWIELETEDGAQA